MGTHPYAGPTHVNKCCPRVGQTKFQFTSNTYPTLCQINHQQGPNSWEVMVQQHLHWPRELGFCHIHQMQYHQELKFVSYVELAWLSYALLIMSRIDHWQISFFQSPLDIQWPNWNLLDIDWIVLLLNWTPLDSTGHWLDIHWICSKSTGFYWSTGHPLVSCRTYGGV